MIAGQNVDWIEDSEKYSLVGPDVKTEGAIGRGSLHSACFSGSIRLFRYLRIGESGWEAYGRMRSRIATYSCSARCVQTSPMCWTAKTKNCSSGPGISMSACCSLVALRRPTSRFYFPARGLTVRLVSANKRISIYGVLYLSGLSGGARQAPRACSAVGGWFEKIASAPVVGGHWRLFRTLHIYCQARATQDILERLHQYARCIDGLILPDAGKRRSNSRAGANSSWPRHHDVMGEIYDIRSADEHLHESRHLEGFDRATRLELLKNEALAEHAARTSLTRIIGDAKLWTHFANTPALGAFWSLPAADRRAIWGDPVDLMKPSPILTRNI